MSVYQFTPSPDVANRETCITWWDNGFSQDEVQRLVSYGNQLVEKEGVDGTVGDNRTDPNYRSSKIAWIGYNQETNWLYDKLSYISRQINGQYYNFDLSGFVEDFQYTIYNSAEVGGDHYDWHMDKGYRDGASPRKLSLVVNLSDPSEYEGGELQFHADRGLEVADKTQGKVHCFPSYILHRVTPVTKGTRRTLVVWIAGPKFR